MGRRRVCVGAVLAVALFAPHAHAQRSRVDLGVIGALNIATLNVDFEGEGVSKDHILGVYAGAFAGVRVAPWVSFEAEVAFAQKGMKISGSSGGADLSETVKFGYIELPVLARIRVVPASARLRPSIYLGPAVSINLSCNVRFKASFAGLDTAFSSKCKGAEDFQSDFPKVNRFDVGLIVGTDVELGPIGVFVRYEHGLKDAFDDPDTSNKHRVITTGVWWRLTR